MPHDSTEARLAKLERQNLSLRRGMLALLALAGVGAVLAGRPAVSQEPLRGVAVEQNGIVLRSAAGRKVSEWTVGEKGDVKLVFYGRTEEERILIEVDDGEAVLSMNDAKERGRMLIRTGADGASDIRFRTLEGGPSASMSIDEKGDAFLGIMDEALRGFVVRAGKAESSLRYDRPDGTTWVPR